MVFPENIHTPSKEGNGNLLAGGGGGGVLKATISEGWGGSRSFQEAASKIGDMIKTNSCSVEQLTVTFLLTSVSGVHCGRK